MKITDIKQQIKVRDRYSIFVDDKFAFGLSELGLINSGLRIGQEFSVEELEVLKRDAQTDKLYNMALGLIARRPRSEWEIRDYLKRKGLDEEEAKTILNTLSIRGYIDDLDFARRWVESRRLLKQMSGRKLSLELRAKRVPDEIIKTVLDEDETDELEVLKELVAKKSTQSRYQDTQKLMAYLARQGFSYDDIKRALADNG